jgi:hypothetical protein
MGLEMFEISPLPLPNWKGFIRMNKIILCPTTTSALNRGSKFWICPEHSPGKPWGITITDFRIHLSPTSPQAKQ